jgi:hypothetical protein
MKECRILVVSIETCPASLNVTYIKRESQRGFVEAWQETRLKLQSYVAFLLFIQKRSRNTAHA